MKTKKILLEKWVGKILTLILLAGIIFVLNPAVKQANATSLDMQDTGYWYNWNIPTGALSWHYRIYNMEGEVTYCIEPNTTEGTNNYILGNWDLANIPNSIRERVALIGYYGYTYPGHQTLAYRAATQGLIWDTIFGEGVNTTFWTGRYQSGTQLDVNQERIEIERLIEHHNDKPSFVTKDYLVQVGEKLTLIDENNVLAGYEISATKEVYSINGNELTINLSEVEPVEFTLTKKMPYQTGYRIFIGEGIQNMFIPGAISPVVAKFKVGGYYGTIEIVKTDSDTGKNEPQGQATLEGAIYGLYNETNELIDTFVTNQDGIGRGNIGLEYGEYYLKEISPSTGYYLDPEIHYISQLSNKVKSVELTEKVIKNKIRVLKQYELFEIKDGSETLVLAPESEVTFEIYDPDGNKFGDFTTDEQGLLEVILPYGTWTFHQANSKEGYEKVEDFNVLVNYDSPLEQYFELLDQSSAPRAVKEPKKSESLNDLVESDISSELEGTLEPTAQTKSKKQSTTINVPNTGKSNYYILETVGVIFIIGGIGTLFYGKRTK